MDGGNKCVSGQRSGEVDNSEDVRVVSEEEMGWLVDEWRSFLEAGGFEGFSDEAIRRLIWSFSEEHGKP